MSSSKRLSQENVWDQEVVAVTTTTISSPTSSSSSSSSSTITASNLAVASSSSSASSPRSNSSSSSSSSSSDDEGERNTVAEEEETEDDEPNNQQPLHSQHRHKWIGSKRPWAGLVPEPVRDTHHYPFALLLQRRNHQADLETDHWSRRPPNQHKQEEQEEERSSRPSPRISTHHRSSSALKQPTTPQSQPSPQRQPQLHKDIVKHAGSTSSSLVASPLPPVLPKRPTDGAVVVDVDRAWGDEEEERSVSSSSFSDDVSFLGHVAPFPVVLLDSMVHLSSAQQEAAVASRTDADNTVRNTSLSPSERIPSSAPAGAERPPPSSSSSSSPPVSLTTTLLSLPYPLCSIDHLLSFLQQKCVLAERRPLVRPEALQDPPFGTQLILKALGVLHGYPWLRILLFHLALSTRGGFAKAMEVLDLLRRDCSRQVVAMESLLRGSLFPGEDHQQGVGGADAMRMQSFNTALRCDGEAKLQQLKYGSVDPLDETTNERGEGSNNSNNVVRTSGARRGGWRCGAKHHRTRKSLDDPYQYPFLILPSAICTANYGLFVTVDLPQKFRLFSYAGELEDSDSIGSGYRLQLSQSEVVDSKLERCICSMMNDARGSPWVNNVAFSTTGYAVTTRRVCQEELFVNYGGSFHMGSETDTASTFSRAFAMDYATWCRGTVLPQLFREPGAHNNHNPNPNNHKDHSTASMSCTKEGNTADDGQGTTTKRRGRPSLGGRGKRPRSA